MSEPARFASHPERRDPKRPVYAVGIGPGNPRYTTEFVRERLAEADVLVGFESVLDRVECATDAEALRCTYDDQEALIARFAERVADGDSGTAVLMGDPNVSGYAFLGRVERAVDRPVRLIPGVSSIQVAASRVRTRIEESTVVTLHKRGDLGADLDRLVRDAGDRHLVVLPRPYDVMPEDVAVRLIDRDVDGELDAFVCERLTLDDESITGYTLDELAAREDVSFSDLSVLVVRKQ